MCMCIILYIHNINGMCTRYVYMYTCVGIHTCYYSYNDYYDVMKPRLYLPKAVCGSCLGHTNKIHCFSGNF